MDNFKYFLFFISITLSAFSGALIAENRYIVAITSLIIGIVCMYYSTKELKQ